MKVDRSAAHFFIIAATVFPLSAQAYVGPGAGLGAIGTVIALLGAVLLGIVGFVWYPVKRLLSKLKKDDAVEEDASNDELDTELAEAKSEQ